MQDCMMCCISICDTTFPVSVTRSVLFQDKGTMFSTRVTCFICKLACEIYNCYVYIKDEATCVIVCKLAWHECVVCKNFVV